MKIISYLVKSINKNSVDAKVLSNEFKGWNRRKVIKRAVDMFMEMDFSNT